MMMMMMMMMMMVNDFFGTLANPTPDFWRHWSSLFQFFLFLPCYYINTDPSMTAS